MDILYLVSLFAVAFFLLKCLMVLGVAGILLACAIRLYLWFKKKLK